MDRPGHRIRILTVGLAVMLAAAAACGDDGGPATPTPPTTAAPSTTAAPTTTVPASTPTTAAPEATTTTSPLATGGAALGEPGPYGVGQAEYETRDASREDRRIRVLAYYPAETSSIDPEADAAPATADAPYPVVVSDSDLAPIMGPHLASHGFVFLSVRSQTSWGMTLSTAMIDYPLDQIAALDALEALDDHLLAGLADTGRAGAIGYSFGSWDALMLAGARIDPEHYLNTCAARPEGWSDNWWGYICGEARYWERIAARAEEVGIATPEGLWESLGDERIKAVMPMGPEGFDLTGPEGLAQATVPALFIAAGNDELNDYDPATTSLFAHYPDAQLITFVGAGHFMILEPDAVQQMRRFAVAFLGYHLLGRDDFAQYLTEEFVEQVAPALGPADSYETIVWGLYEE